MFEFISKLLGRKSARKNKNVPKEGKWKEFNRYGTVVAEGARLGVPTPVNAAVVEVAHRIERGELVPGTANVDELLRLT